MNENKEQQYEIWYELYHNQIKQVEIEKTTENFVVLKGKKHKVAKITTGDSGACYYPTFAKAKQALLDRLAKNIDTFNWKIKQYQTKVSEIYELIEKIKLCYEA